jgi:hypothetical protein
MHGQGDIGRFGEFGLAFIVSRHGVLEKRDSWTCDPIPLIIHIGLGFFTCFFLARTRSFMYSNIFCSSFALYSPSAAPSSLNFLTLMLPSSCISSGSSHTFLPAQVNMVSFCYEAYGK